MIVVEVPPGEDVLDPVLARIKQRVGEVCFLKIVSPEDAMEVYFQVGMPFNISFDVVCVEDEMQDWLAARAPSRRGVVATVLLDGDIVCNFTLPDVVQALIAFCGSALKRIAAACLAVCSDGICSIVEVSASS